ncbi:Glycerophosphoryl diester phosphodiesterase [hydrothermal vent metagenome]|uniref:Glycerophosphoryl diester phosphodiesterase n=1 Tax=hydrothermal vent metagenome TaxID=652676 RepID=A0A3B1BGR7_9ZZZZ
MAKSPTLVAHRGQMETCPENTLLAIETALQCGAPCVEFDVQSTADGMLVVFHDVELERVTGVKGNLFTITHTELEELRVTEPKRFHKGAFSEPIPTLFKVVELLQRYPKARAFVEIKCETIAMFGTQQVMDHLLAAIDPIHQQCVVISFSLEAIEYTQQHSNLKTGWVLDKYDEEHHQCATALNPDYLIVNHTKLLKGQAPWPGDWEWMLYDITDPELYMKYANDVALIETRDICTMLQYLADQ